MLAVDRQARSGERPRTERQHVGPPAAVGEPLTVAAELLAPRQELVRREERLRPPQVRIARDHEPLLPLRHAEKGSLEFDKSAVKPVDCPPTIQPQVGCDLVVAAARCVEFPAGVAQPSRQRRLDVEMDVFLRHGVFEPAGVDLTTNLLKHVRDRIGLLHRHQTAVGQHLRMGDRAVDVIVGQPPVERHALGEELDPLVGWLAEHAPPGLAFGGGRIGLRIGGVGHAGIPCGVADAETLPYPAGAWGNPASCPSVDSFHDEP